MDQDLEFQFDIDDDDLNNEEEGEINEKDQARGIQPYLFEPEFDEADDGEADHEIPGVDNDQEDLEGRFGNNNWCSCSGGCTAMPKLKEHVCCKEIVQVVREMDAYTPAELDCVTEHPGFQSVCLDEWVLNTAYKQYAQQYGGAARQDVTPNERSRHVAYRQLVRWCWGFLGRRIRVPLPSCAVNLIRNTFPSDIFHGFEEA